MLISVTCGALFMYFLGPNGPYMCLVTHWTLQLFYICWGMVGPLVIVLLQILFLF